MKGVQILMMNQQSEGLGYGYLYNQYAIGNVAFAPTGWHIPTITEYYMLVNYVGSQFTAGRYLKETGFVHWVSPNTGATNSSGFSAFGGGRRKDDGSFLWLKYFGNFATTDIVDNKPVFMIMAHDNDDANPNTINQELNGLSVRLLKDSTTLSDGETSTMTDEDGNVYDTICIGTQEWTVQNWKCTKLNDGTSLTKVTSNTTWAGAGAGDEYYCAYDNDESNV